MDILLKIWVQPRAIIGEIIERKSVLWTTIILIIGSIGVTFSTLFDSNIPNLNEFFLIFLLILLLSPLFYYLASLMVTSLTLLSTKWIFKGTGTFWDTFKVVCVSYLPFSIPLPIFLIWLVINPESLLFPGFIEAIIALMITIGPSIYSMVFFVLGLSEANKFSILKSFGTLAITSIFLIIITIILGIIFLTFYSIFWLVF